MQRRIGPSGHRGPLPRGANAREPRRVLAAVIALIGLTVSACSDPERERLEQTTKPTYDKATGKLVELTYDANKNGTIDTWTEMDGARPVRSRIDRDEDGRIDRWEYYDGQGLLEKVGFSRQTEGKPDAWAYANADGRIARVDVSSVADQDRIDRREFYDASVPPGQDDLGPLLRVEADTDGNGRMDKWEAYQAGALRTAEFDEDGDGRPDRRLTYRDATLVTIESHPDATGGYTRKRDVKP